MESHGFSDRGTSLALSLREYRLHRQTCPGIQSAPTFGVVGLGRFRLFVGTRFCFCLFSLCFSRVSLLRTLHDADS